jgi:hypothetical protein
MKDQRVWLFGTIAAIVCFLLGQLNAGRQVRAASDDVQFQLHGLDAQDGLMLYYPGQRTLYVYQAIMTGNSTLQCSYKLKFSEPGGVIHRQQCDIQKLFP